MRQVIRFVRNGRIVVLADVSPTETVLDYLRLRARKTGTKEGCGEGDCGACTVALGTLEDGKVQYRAVNACIMLLGQIDGKELIVVEDLEDPKSGLHPVQQAMVDHHAAQCGFCTPGFVMSLFTLHHQGRPSLRRSEVNDWLAGNLCRCTGYRPIVSAAMDSCVGTPSDKFMERAQKTANLLSQIDDADDVFIGTSDRFLAAPASIESLAKFYLANPDATLVAGATDVGLWVTKSLANLPKVILLHRVAGLDRVEDTGSDLLIGASATYANVEPYIRRIDPDLAELWRRIGSKQVRATGTVGGNIANGSPIGDTPPALIALDAMIELRRGDDLRTLYLDDFFIDYGKQDRAPGEFITGILLPKPSSDHVFRCYKITKRFDQDISSVLGAFRFTVRDNKVTRARIAYGGMAATPKRAPNAEAAVAGVDLAMPATWSDPLNAVLEDFKPIGDHRASARYRIETARSLLGKALVEAGGTVTSQTRVTGIREVWDVTAL